MKSSKSSNLFKDTLSKLLRKPSGKTSRNGRQDTVISSKVVPIASSSDSRFNSEDVYDPVAEWKTGPVQHHPGASDAEVSCNGFVQAVAFHVRRKHGIICRCANPSV